MPLHAVCLEQNLPDREKRVDALIKAGADPNFPFESDTEGTVPSAVLAVMKDAPGCAIAMLKNGADMTATTENGIDVAIAAAVKGAGTVLSFIQKEAETRPGGWDWTTTCSLAVTLAALHGRPTRYHGCNALHLAAFHGQVVSLQFYLNNKYLPIDGNLLHPRLHGAPLRRHGRIPRGGGAIWCPRAPTSRHGRMTRARRCT